jgi:hypothetical protein
MRDGENPLPITHYPLPGKLAELFFKKTEEVKRLRSGRSTAQAVGWKEINHWVNDCIANMRF